MSASAAAEFYDASDDAYGEAQRDDDVHDVIVVRAARTPRRIDRLAAVDRRATGLQVVQAAGLAGVVRPASAHTTEAVGARRVLPVLSELRALLPGGGLRRGATIAVHTSSVLLALLVAASKAGSWCAVVGLPALSPIAAAEMGIALDRLALVPNPGTEWITTVAALLDGLDIVVAAPPGPIAPAVANRLAARARQRGSVLMPAGAWTGADLTVAPVRGAWDGLGTGRGRLRCREMTIQARGRGAAVAPREVTLWLPALEGALPPINQGLSGVASRFPTTPDLAVTGRSLALAPDGGVAGRSLAAMPDGGGRADDDHAHDDHAHDHQDSGAQSGGGQGGSGQGGGGRGGDGRGAVVVLRKVG